MSDPWERRSAWSPLRGTTVEPIFTALPNLLMNAPGPAFGLHPKVALCPMMRRLLGNQDIETRIRPSPDCPPALFNRLAHYRTHSPRLFAVFSLYSL